MKEGCGPHQLSPAAAPEWLLTLIRGNEAAANSNIAAAGVSIETQNTDGDTRSDDRVAQVVKAMRGLYIADENDGSRRVLFAAGIAVKHDLSDAEAVAAIQTHLREVPAPRPYTEADILQRIRDAEKHSKRGEALNKKQKGEGKSVVNVAVQLNITPMCD